MGAQDRAGSLTLTLGWAWARLGDPAARSMRVALLYLPLSLVGPMLVDVLRWGGSLLLWAAVGMVGEVVVIAVFATLGTAVNRVRVLQSSAITTVGVIVTAVALRSLVVAWVAFAWGLTPFPEWGYRFGSAIVTQSGLLAVIAVLVSSFTYHRGIARDLATQRAQMLELRRTLNERLAESRAALAAEVRRTIDPLIDQLDRRLTEAVRGGDPRAVQGIVREIVDDDLRPLSHRLANPEGLPSQVQRMATPPARVRIPLPARCSLRFLIRPLPIALLAALLASSQALRALSFIDAVVFVLSGAVVVWLLLTGIRAAIGRWAPRLWIGLTTATFLSTIVVWSTLVLIRALGSPSPYKIGLGAMAMGVALGLLTAAYAVVTERRVATEEELSSSIDELQVTLSVLRQHDFVARRELGYVLHGSVQSALHAAAMRLAAHPHPDEELLASIRHDIAEATARIDRSTAPNVMLVDTLADIAELWDGTCTVRWTLDHRTVRLLVESPTAATSVAEIARECVGNAIRHGHATEVWTTISTSGDRVVLTTLDNGSEQTEWTPGLGSRMLDEMCVTWRHEPAEPGTRIVAEVATDRSLL